MGHVLWYCDNVYVQPFQFEALNASHTSNAF